jgi:hypothetical protein
VANWYYQDILVEIQATITHNKLRYAIPMPGNESIDHALLKVSIAAHLLSWGYTWEQIRWEETPPKGPREFRPDLYTEDAGNLPRFWFECGHTGQEKLRTVVATLPEFRVVRVVDDAWFIHFWNGENSCVVNDKIIELDEVKDWKERRRLVLQQREEVIPCGAECWTIRARESSPRIVYAVRRELDGHFTYLDSEEGWSLSSFRYVFNRSVSFRPLIPGVVGSEKWTGRSQIYYSDK